MAAVRADRSVRGDSVGVNERVAPASGGSRGASPSVSRRALFGLVALVGMAIVGLLLLEGVLRVVSIDLPAPPIYPGDHVAVESENTDPDLGWKLAPNRTVEQPFEDGAFTYHTNALGFRGSAAAIAPGTRGVAFLGDSYTLGHGVADDETFPSLLASRLSLSPCCNFGVSGYSIGQMWRTLETHALPLQPSAVVLSFIFNDFYREQAYHQFSTWTRRPVFTLVGGVPVPMTEANRPGAVYRLFAQHTKLYAAWMRVESAAIKRYPVGGTWRLNHAIFAAIRDACRAQGVPLLVVYLPQRDLYQPLPMLAPEFAALGIDFVDLSLALPPDPRSLYFSRDLHMNAAGNRFVADRLEGTLRAILK
ncbi:MAG TPA: SGNH/GDSL hydrolase family protein [Vicinamibacterales bacterium]|nr:SGNH/GDSL hydrolase family protein [Vicinamibacterales bacterium]